VITESLRTGASALLHLRRDTPSGRVGY